MFKPRPFLSAVSTIKSVPVQIPQSRLMSTATPKFAEGSDTAVLTPILEGLLTRPNFPWRLTPSGEGVERSFKFKTFAKTWDFMTAVSLQCKVKNHHPEWSNVFNTTFIRWTTHNPKGLSVQDLSMAALCDELARQFGEVAPEGQSSAASDLVGRATTAAGDCCTPKK